MKLSTLRMLMGLQRYFTKKDKVGLEKKKLMEDTQHNYYSYHGTMTSPDNI